MKTRTLAYTHKMARTLRRPIATALTVATLNIMAGGSARAAFLDLFDVPPGVGVTSPNLFNGTLNGVSVSGSIVPGSFGFSFNPAIPSPNQFFDSTTDNKSPQYSYGNIYTPSAPLTDCVGYDGSGFTGAGTSATVIITFGSPIVNPTLHVANLDALAFDFVLTTTTANTPAALSQPAGSGNYLASDNDGLLVSGTTVFDANPSTVTPAGLDAANVAPLTTMPRSAYGSVLFTGSYSSLIFRVYSVNPAVPNGDLGSFTFSAGLSAVPEPGSVALLVGLTTVGAGVLRRKRRK